jgi:UDP-N-acetylmuramate dehydrogenase
VNAADRPIDTGSEHPWMELETICPGRVAFDVPLGELTTLRIGGAADALVRPIAAQEVVRVIRWAGTRGIPYFVMGKGSNMLVTDRGVRGIVMVLASAMDALESREVGPTISIRAGAGLSLVRLLHQAIRQGWGDLEFLIGIPGTLGGAVAMNAGTSQEAVDRLVRAVHWVGPNGQQIRRPRERLVFGYRGLHRPPGCVIVEVELNVHPKPREEIRTSLRERMVHRRRTQPYTMPSAGSVFKNPMGFAAGQLIEAAGLKGKTIGGAMVSPQHANFIVNLGNATAGDVLALIDTVRRCVYQRFAMVLELEIQIMGEVL